MREHQFVAPLRIPGVRWLMTTSVVARLPVAMTGLAIVLRITRGGGSYSAAGGVTAAYARAVVHAATGARWVIVLDASFELGN